MTIHKINDDEDKGYCHTSEARLMITDHREQWHTGYHIGWVTADEQCRREDGGPILPGPHAFAGEHAAILSGSGHGTAYDIEIARRSGTLIEARIGDLLQTPDGTLYRIEWLRDRGPWIKLTVA